MNVREYYRPQPMAANSTYKVVGNHVAGFLCTVAGTLTVADAAGNVLLNAMPVATGFNRLAITLPTLDGGTVTLAGGAAGSLLIV